MKSSLAIGLLALWTVFMSNSAFPLENPPHIIFVMTDDQGWGQTGYRNHPVLKTPNLDRMAENGLRFERFYSGGPVCSPTRASVLTGRTHDRCGVLSYGYGLRTQEKTLSQALKNAGYVTGHFGKWHLNGLSGPGVPILENDPRHPGHFGFDEWVSVSNFYDRDPIMSRMGVFEEFQGDSSEIAVAEAVKFLEKHVNGGKPMFLLVWFGSPHLPFKASEEDRKAFENLDEKSANHYGELAAMDRSVGTLRQKLRDLKIAENTLLFFCSDNGGLKGVKPDSVGSLRGYKGDLYEGGIRVPGIIEWPAVIKPRVTHYPACVTDLFPTIVDILDLPADTMLKPIDGISLKPLFSSELDVRRRPLGFRYYKQRAWIDNRYTEDGLNFPKRNAGSLATQGELRGRSLPPIPATVYKLVSRDFDKDEFELYDLENDPGESKNIASEHPEIIRKMTEDLFAWNRSVDASFAGKDYPEGKVVPADSPQVRWINTLEYRPFLEQWKDRWEYRNVIKQALEKK